MLVAGCSSDEATDQADLNTAPPVSTVAPPKSTIPPEVDAVLLEGYKPMDVSGEPLPPLESPKPNPDDPAIGMPAPVFVGYDLDGNAITIDATRQGPTMIVVLAHWCPHCNAEVPIYKQLYDSQAFPDDLNVIAILAGSTPQQPNWPPGEWIRSKNWPYPAMFDGIETVTVDDEEQPAPIAMRYLGGSGYPFVVMVGDDGTVLSRWGGEATYEQIEANTLDALSRGSS